jgi:choline dehydrogenase-like flavoprotein
MPEYAEQVDVLIVGSGPAGSTYARTIGDARPDARILMVEVGPKLTDAIGEHTTNLTDDERTAAQLAAQGPDAGTPRSGWNYPSLGQDGSQGQPAMFIFPGLFLVGEGSKVAGEFGLPAACMSSGVGGMGVHWSGSSPRPTSTERIPFIAPDELDAAYDRAEQLLRVSKDLQGDDPLLTELKAVIAAEFDADDPGGPAVDFMPVASSRDGDGLRASGTSPILGDIGARVAGFEIRPDTLVRRIVVENGTAVGAELLSRTSGESYAVSAGRVVVCGDSLRTPQLLFASGIRPRALGHHLNDHFQMGGFARLRPEYVRAEEAGAPKVYGSVRIPYVVDVRPMQGQVVAFSRSGYQHPIGDALSAFISLDEVALVPWYGAKDIQFSDAVVFSEEKTDFYGMPAMTIHYTLTDTDQRTIELLRANTERSCKLIGEPLGEPKLAPGGSSLHYQGTVRMGVADDGNSVCDSYSRVWGINNLYVGGNGVIPTSTAANPTLTNVALAYRAASRLAATL